MKKTEKNKEATTKDRRQEESEKTQDVFYAEFSDQDEITLRPEELLACDIASHLAMLTAARLDEALLGTNPMVAKILTKKLEESDAEEMISMLHAIFLTSGMINASEDLDALRFCEKYDNAIYMHFQDELTDADVFDWYRIEELFEEYFEEKRLKLIRFPVEVMKRCQKL